MLTSLLALTTTLAYAQGAWLTVPSMPTARLALAGTDAPCPKGVAGLREGTCVYAIGGNNGTTDLNTLEAYSPATNTWATLPSMPTARAGLAAATAPCPKGFGGLRGLCVYAIGGQTSGTEVATVEAYSPATNTWATLPSMPTARAGLAATDAPCPRGVSGLRGRCVYALGGFNRTSVALNTVEAYSPATNTWATLPSMPTGRSLLAAATAPCPKADEDRNASCVYAIGGTNGIAVVATTEAYSPATNTWVTVPPMPTARSALAAAAAPCPHGSTGHKNEAKNEPEVGAPSQGHKDGNEEHRGKTCVYALGGNDGVNDLATAEAYSPAANNWSTLPSMPTARRLLAAATAPCPDSEHRTCVYTMGGANGPNILSTVEAFGIETWRQR